MELVQVIIHGVIVTMRKKIYDIFSDFVHNKYTLLVFIAIVSILLVTYLFGLREGRKYSDINVAIQNSNESATRAGEYIISAQSKLNHVEESLDRAGEEIRAGRTISAEMQAEFNECENLIDECIERNRNTQTILKGLRAGNRE